MCKETKKNEKNENFSEQIYGEEQLMTDDSKEIGIQLLKKGKQGIFRMVFSRSGLIIVLLTIQVLFLFSIFHRFEEFLPHI